MVTATEQLIDRKAIVTLVEKFHDNHIFTVE